MLLIGQGYLKEPKKLLEAKQKRERRQAACSNFVLTSIHVCCGGSTEQEEEEVATRDADILTIHSNSANSWGFFNSTYYCSVIVGLIRTVLYQKYMDYFSSTRSNSWDSK